MNDFEQIPWGEIRSVTRWDGPVVDAEFTVEDEEQSGSAWDVWALTFPHREHDARKYLIHVETAYEIYWYRDRRDERVYGMPDIELARAENERVIEKNRTRHLGGARRVAIALVMLTMAILLIGIPLMPDVAPWLILALPVLAFVVYRRSARFARPRYDRLTEFRFDLFESDQERRDRRNRWIVYVVTAGLAVLWLRHRH